MERVQPEAVRRGLRRDDLGGVALRAVAACLPPGSPVDGHERTTLEWIAREVADLGGCRYAGVREVSVPADEGCYLVPADTLVAPDPSAAPREDALLGGVVPFAFVGTKAVVHPLVPDAHAAPAGWAHALGEALADATLPGYTAFCSEDARRAGERLLRDGHRVRLKRVLDSGSAGQVRAADAGALHAAIDTWPAGRDGEGYAIEADLERTITYSIGSVFCLGVRIAYVGRQYATRDESGGPAYGGSDLSAIRGGLDALPDRLRPGPLREAALRALAFDRRVGGAYEGIVRSRCNYDVIVGTDARGVRRCAVLEQSWRVGGATPAELCALRRLLRDRAAVQADAATREVYGDARVPPGATVYCRGARAGAGRVTKYLLPADYGTEAFSR